jgi:HK97 family phage major capsid protein
MKAASTLQKFGIEIKDLNKQVRAIHDEVDEKQEGVATSEQIVQVKDLNKKIEELEMKASETEEWQTSGEAARRREKGQDPIIAPGIMRMIERKNLSDHVLDDPDFKAFMAKDYGSRAIEFKQSPSAQVDVKTLITGASVTSGGALVVSDRKPIIDQGTSYRPLTLMDIITVGETNGDSVSYVRQGTHTNNAAGVAEATATGDGTGGKPESAMALSVVNAAVENIAHWLPATRRALSDAGQLRTLIDNFLRYGLMEELEDLMVNGNGTSPNLTGITNTSGTTTQAFDTDILTTTRKARTKVRTTGRARPTAFVMNPSDWETIDLLQDNEARYYFGGPSVIGNPRLWGLPVVECEACTAGAALCADFRLAVLWLREDAQILVSDSHSDFFTRNLIAILAEMRAAFGVLRPAAFVEIDLTA